MSGAQRWRRQRSIAVRQSGAHNAGVPHLVPLTKGALRVLKAVRDAQSDAAAPTWLFPAAAKSCEVCGQDGHMDKPNKAYTAIKGRADITDRGLLHRFRDTIKTRMSEHGVSERVMRRCSR